MAEYLIQDTTLTAIADSIRDKKDSTATIAVNDFSDTIDSINSDVTATASNMLNGVIARGPSGKVIGTIATKTSSDLTASGATVSVPTGYYASNASKSVATVARADTTISVTTDDTNDKLTLTASNNQGTGYVTGSNKTATKTVTLTTSGATATMSDGTNSVSKSVTTATQATPGITVSSAGLITASATQTAGYVAEGTKSATKQLTTKAATTITPGTSAKTAVASGVYTTGAITVAGDADLKAANIKSGVNIFGVTGTLVGETIGAVSKGTIVVTYPSGATCTVYNSSGTTYTALDTTGIASFIVAAGTWTVKIVKSGYTTKTASVTVSAKKYIEVELGFDLILFSNGTDNTSITGGIGYVCGNYPGPSLTIKNGNLVYSQPNDFYGSDQRAFVGTTNKIDLTDYSIFEVVIASTGTPSRAVVGACNSRSWDSIGNAGVSTVSARAAGTYQVDISDINGEYYLGWGFFTPTYGAFTCTFSSFKLIP